jgi:hypothetical protein
MMAMPVLGLSVCGYNLEALKFTFLFTSRPVIPCRT